MYGHRKQGETQNVVLFIRVLKAKTQETETKIGIRENASQSELKFFSFYWKIGCWELGHHHHHHLSRRRFAGRKEFELGGPIFWFYDGLMRRHTFCSYNHHHHHHHQLLPLWYSDHYCVVIIFKLGLKKLLLREQEQDTRKMWSTKTRKPNNRRFSYLLLGDGDHYIQDWIASCRPGLVGPGNQKVCLILPLDSSLNALPSLSCTRQDEGPHT